MTDKAQRNDTHSLTVTSAYAALTRAARPGQAICFRSSPSSDSPERNCIVREFHPDGMVVDTDSGTEWVPAQDVQVWRVPKQPSSYPRSPEEPATIEPVITPKEPSTSLTVDTAQGPSMPPQQELLSPPTITLPSPADLELLFAGDPVLLLPKPSFNFPSLSKEIQQDINRWKDRYEYAQKVREPARMSQDVARIVEIADTLQEPSLYFLAGLLADSSGLGSSRAKAFFQNALELDQNHQEAATAVAALAIKENEWSTAVKFLLWASRLEGDIDKTTLVRCIGQCVLRIDNGNIPPIGLLLSLELPETAKRLAISLVALLVKEDSEAYEAALSCNVLKLRQTKIGNDLFPWKEDIPAPVQAKIAPYGMKPSTSGRDTIRKGRVSAYYSARNFGFIVEDVTGQTWFFHKKAIISPSLLNSLIEGRVRQDVTFAGSVEAKSGKYPLADDVSILTEETEIQAEAPKRAPLRLRLQAIPKDGSSFAKAMEAEQLDQLDRAETFYLEEITKDGRHVKSAIKNLAALKNRKGKPDIAIQILDKYHNVFDQTERPSLDQMRVQFLVKARNFNQAAQLLAKLAKGTANMNKRVEYLRQEAYCLLASGDFDGSIKKLTAIVKSYPGDNASALLLAKAKDAKQTGQVPSEVTAGKDDDEYDDILSSLALGISPIARRQLENCELRGIDARTRESGVFTDQDVRQVQNLLDNVKGRRPRERADYLLTLAWLCEHASSVTGNRSVHEYLRRYFLALAEATFSDGSPKDVVRCYCLESLALCPMHFEARSDSRNSFEAAMVLLLGTYLSDAVEPSTLLQPSTGNRLPKVVQLLDGQPSGWKAFLQDALFYSHRAPAAFQHLQSNLKNHPEVIGITKSTSIEGERTRRFDSAFATLPNDSLSADRLRQTREALAENISTLRFELDRVRMSEFVKILGDAAEYVLERRFRECETRYLKLEANISRVLEELYRHPTHLSLERLAPALSSLHELVKADFSRVETTKPVLELRNVLDNDFYVISDGSVALRLLLASKDESAPPIEAIGLMLEQGEGEPCHSPEPLHGGQTREIELAVRPTEKQIHDGAFSVTVRVEYRTRKGATERSQPFSLAVRLGNPAFDEIPNPYGRYSGGSPVEDEAMFFGRAALIDRIIQYLSTGTMGQCFVLYGQKRSGKSSVLKQVEKRLGRSVLFTPMSAGTFSPGNLWSSFARMFLQELTFRLEDTHSEIPENWPSRSDVDARPLETIRDVVRGLTKRGYQVILAIDEFTYIFENAHSDLETFMRGWKALLEARTFNAILVGQDTMPRFKQAFPNEFGVTHDERITYLDENEAADLASRPILLDGASRYRGQALHRLFDLTAGSPFFLQIACDWLVRHLNARKAAFVTEADIEQVARTLTIGGDALPPERFDGLVTAAGEKVAAVPRYDLWRVLTRVARESLHTGWCYKDALLELPRSFDALKDLIDREILAVEGERVKIRVGLFAAWLRANQYQ